MTTVPTNTNAAAGAVNSVIAAAAQGVITAAETAIEVDVPFLALPGIKQIWQALFEWIAGYIVRALETAGTFTVISIQTGIEKQNLSIALQNVIAAEKSGDKNAIAAAIQAYQQAQSALVNSDGSSAPS